MKKKPWYKRLFQLFDYKYEFLCAQPYIVTNNFTGKRIRGGYVDVFVKRRASDSGIESIFAKHDGTTTYFNVKIYQDTGKLVESYSV